MVSQPVCRLFSLLLNLLACRHWLPLLNHHPNQLILHHNLLCNPRINLLLDQLVSLLLSPLRNHPCNPHQSLLVSQLVFLRVIPPHNLQGNHLRNHLLSQLASLRINQRVYPLYSLSHVHQHNPLTNHQ